MIVVLDSNVWLTELALNSGAGSALRFFLKQHAAKLAVPEVVRLEVTCNLQSQIATSVGEIRQAHRKLLALFGNLKEVVLPTDSEIEALAAGVFDHLGIEFVPVPLSLDSTLSALSKVIKREPPADRTQEFKDAVIWADCLALSETDSVLFATADKAFFDGRDYEKGLARNLREEARPRPNSIRVTHSIGGVLEQFGGRHDIDKQRVALDVVQQARPRLEAMLSAENAHLSGNPAGQVDLFATEDPGRLFFTYKVEVPCESEGSDDRVSLRLHGSGSLIPDSAAVLDVHPESDSLVLVRPDGEVQRRKTSMFATGTAYLGHRTVKHEVRYPLDVGVKKLAD